MLGDVRAGLGALSRDELARSVTRTSSSKPHCPASPNTRRLAASRGTVDRRRVVVVAQRIDRQQRQAGGERLQVPQRPGYPPAGVWIGSHGSNRYAGRQKLTRSGVTSASGTWHLLPPTLRFAVLRSFLIKAATNMLVTIQYCVV